MKKLIFILLLIPFAVKAQNYTVGTPAIRVNTSGTINLTTTWQTVNFNGTSTNNFNIYPKDPSTGNQMIWWDSANQLFRVYGNYNRMLSLQLFPKYTTTVITTGATLQMRCVIPNGVSPGVDKYFPYPDDGGYADIANVAQFTVSQNQPIIPISVYTNPALITNGFYIQLRLSNALFGAGVCTLNSAAVVIQSPF